MPNKHPLLKLSPEEELFLRHWMYDEVHYKEGPGRAKSLQLQRRAVPADLATLIAAAIPRPAPPQRQTITTSSSTAAPPAASVRQSRPPGWGKASSSSNRASTWAA